MHRTVMAWVWVRRKAILWGLLAAVLGQQAWTHWAEPALIAREGKRLAVARRHAMFYEQLPMFQSFWTTTMQCSSEFSVGRIMTETSNSALCRGLIWANGHTKLIGSFRTDAVFPIGSASPISATTWLTFDRSAVQEILEDPLSEPTRPFWPFLGKPKNETSVLGRDLGLREGTEAVQTLGNRLKAVVREMKGMGSRQLRFWGMDALLSFDQEKNLEIVLSMPLPNRYFTPVNRDNRDKAVRFYGEVSPKLLPILYNSAFIGDVQVTEVVSTMGLPSVGGGSAMYMILTRTGVPFRAHISKTGNFWELSLSASSQEYGKARDKYNPEFLKILNRSRTGPIDEMLSLPHYILTDKDIEDALKVKPLEHSKVPG
ncbi:MAG: hypothetical protein ABL962_08070 [Fimbriimonadaceae bacterium]